MKNHIGIDDFWQIGTIYKHMGYPSIKWKLVGSEDWHVRLENIANEKPYYLLVPKETRAWCMYKYPFQSSPALVCGGAL